MKIRRSCLRHSSLRVLTARGFSLPELLVTLGIIALLIAIMLPPLQLAHRQARATQCAAQLQQLGLALEACRMEYKYYPIWDDGAQPIRFTWIDVLVQRNLIPDKRLGYCPDDPGPSPLNAARGQHFRLIYPGHSRVPGIDYSYGIAVPLASGAWNWSPGGDVVATVPRRLENHEKLTASRVLAGDANWSAIYNLSGSSPRSTDWSFPTQYDNTVEWRHAGNRANLLMQDGHVSQLANRNESGLELNTQQHFVWHQGESLYVGPWDRYGRNFYPNAPPVNLVTGETRGAFPAEVVPGYYTYNQLWTRIHHK